MVIEHLPSVYMVFEDETVWKIQQTRNPTRSHWSRRRRRWHYWWLGTLIESPDMHLNRPQELEKFDFVWSGTLYGTNETVWWGYTDPQRREYFDGYVYNSKTKETRRFVRLIRDYVDATNTTDVDSLRGVLFDKELNYRVQCVKHFKEHNCFGRKTARRWWLSRCKGIGGFICRKVGSNSSKDFYLVGTKEAEHRFEFKDFRDSQRCVETKKRKERKQMLTQKRRKKEKLVSKARRRARDRKYLQC